MHGNVNDHFPLRRRVRTVNANEEFRVLKNNKHLRIRLPAIQRMCWLLKLRTSPMPISIRSTSKGEFMGVDEYLRWKCVI